MKNKTIGSIVIIALLLIVGLTAYSTYRKERDNTRLPDQITTPGTQKKIKLADSWTTFDSTYGYSLQHPSDWEYEVAYNQDPELSYKIRISSPCQLDTTERCLDLDITAIPYGSAYTGYEVIDEEDKSAPYFFIEDKDTVSDKVTTINNGITQTTFNYLQNSSVNPTWEKVLVADVNNIRYTYIFRETIGGEHSVDPQKWANIELYNQIISSITYTTPTFK